MNASEMKVGQRGKVIKLTLPKAKIRRCFNLGIYEGSQLKLIRKAPFHDPYVFAINGNELVMRKVDAARIEVELL